MHIEKRNILPGFLIVGSMKSGTTTLYYDLMSHPDIFLPDEKETNILVSSGKAKEVAARKYNELYAKAPQTCMCGEASVSYTSLPNNAYAPSFAYDLIGPSLKVIYIIRDPIERIKSHHRHQYSKGKAKVSIDNEIRNNSSYLNISRYAMQIQPWIDLLGTKNVKIIRFETYIKEREKTISEVCSFLGVDSSGLKINPEKVVNSSKGKPVLTRRWKRIAENTFYRHYVRKFLSFEAREKIRYLLLPKAPSQPEDIKRETCEWLVHKLGDDVKKVSSLAGWDKAMWHRWR